MAGVEGKDLTKTLEVMLEVLIKLGVLPPNVDKKGVVKNVQSFLEESGMDLKNSDLKKPETKNTLCTALTIAAVSGNNPGARQTMGLLIEPNRSPEQNAKLTLSLAAVAIMKKNPGLKLDLNLFFKDPKQMTAKEKELMGVTIKLILVKSRKHEIDLDLDIKPEDAKAVSAAADAVTNELTTPGSTAEKIKSGAMQKDQMERDLFGGGQGPIVANALGVPDQFPAYSASSPIHMLSGAILSPSQAATGELAIAASRDLSDEFGDIESEERNLDANWDNNDTEPKSEVGDALDSLSSLLAETASDSDNDMDNDAETPAVELADVNMDFSDRLSETIDNSLSANNIKTHDSPRPKPPGSPPTPG
jgi:hypothetical protein